MLEEHIDKAINEGIRSDAAMEKFLRDRGATLCVGPKERT